MGTGLVIHRLNCYRYYYPDYCYINHYPIIFFEYLLEYIEIVIRYIRIVNFLILMRKRGNYD